METVVSDNQPSFKQGLSHVARLLSEPPIVSYLKSNNIAKFRYLPYPSGASLLRAAVESLVGQVKNVLYASIGNKITDLVNFVYAVPEAKPLVNKRLLSSNSLNSELPFAIILIRGNCFRTFRSKQNL